MSSGNTEIVKIDLLNQFVRVSYSWQRLTDLQLNHLMKLNNLLLYEEPCPALVQKRKEQPDKNNFPNA